MSFTRKIDGNWDKPHATSLLVGSAPFANIGDHREYIFEQNYVQLGAKFKPLTLGTRHANGAYLVEETPRRDIGGGAVEWTRVWAKLPRRQETPGATVGVSSEEVDGTVFAFARASVATIYYDFYYAPGEQWKIIPCYQAGRALSVNGTTLVIPTTFVNAAGNGYPLTLTCPVPLYGDTRSIAEDSTLEQWYGPIYKRTTITIPRINIADAIARGAGA